MMFLHFIAAYFRAQWFKFRGFQVLADPARQGIRHLYCVHCDKYENGLCAACGCLVASKVTLNSEKCPLNYWPREWVRKDSDS